MYPCDPSSFNCIKKSEERLLTIMLNKEFVKDFLFFIKSLTCDSLLNYKPSSVFLA